MTYALYYIIAGFAWTGFLEFLTSKFPDTEHPVNWRWGLRIPMIILWPIMFVTFWITIIKGILNKL